MSARKSFYPISTITHCRTASNGHNKLQRVPWEKNGQKKPHQNKASVGSTQGFVELSVIGKTGTQEQ